MILGDPWAKRTGPESPPGNLEAEEGQEQAHFYKTLVEIEIFF